MTKPRCVLPWYQMVLYPGGGLRPCCKDVVLMREKIPLTDVASTMDIFNCQDMVRLRRALLSGDLEGTVCSTCPSTGWETTIPAEYYSQSLSGDYLRSYLEIIKDFPEIISRPPLHIWMQLSKKCNLNCIMCIQKPLKASDHVLFPVDQFIRIIENDGLDSFASMTFWGGEPMFCPDGLQLIDYFIGASEQKKLHTIIQMISNGVLLCKMREDIKKIDKLFFNFSIDALNSRYESIRIGAEFGELTDSIAWYKKNKPECWKYTSVNCVVMKCNVLHLDEVIHYCNEIGLRENALSFSPVYGCPEENFLENPALVASDDFIPACIATAELADKMKQHYAAGHIREIIERYEKKIASLITPPESSKIAIFGTGSRAKELSKLIGCHRKDIDIVFHVDSYQDTNPEAGTVNVRDLKEHANQIDCIMIASAYHKEITDGLKNIGFDRFTVY